MAQWTDPDDYSREDAIAAGTDRRPRRIPLSDLQTDLRRYAEAVESGDLDPTPDAIAWYAEALHFVVFDPQPNDGPAWPTGVPPYDQPGISSVTTSGGPTAEERKINGY